MSDAARRVRLLVLDVDGVLTDNGVFLGQVAGERVELKRFDIQDGVGLALLRGGPIEVIWISARASPATVLRAGEVNVTDVIQLADGRKAPALEALLERKGLEWEHVAFVGDDLIDLPVLRRAGLPIAVANAVPEVKAAAAYVTRSPGGSGAVREAVEFILRARGEYETAVEHYLGRRESEAVA